MRRSLTILFVLLFLWGCTVKGRDFPSSAVKDIRPNVTTKVQIFSAFGEPVEKGIDTGYETWTYYHYSLGKSLGEKRLHIIFNKDGTVRNYSFSSS